MTFYLSPDPFALAQTLIAARVARRCGYGRFRLLALMSKCLLLLLLLLRRLFLPARRLSVPTKDALSIWRAGAWVRGRAAVWRSPTVTFSSVGFESSHLSMASRDVLEILRLRVVSFVLALSPACAFAQMVRKISQDVGN
ncbi:hypothetical protein IWX49DRAFT_565035 [Phyllosticta citricarpa]